MEFFDDDGAVNLSYKILGSKKTLKAYRMTESDKSGSYNLETAGVQSSTKATEASKSQSEIQKTPEQEKQTTRRDAKDPSPPSKYENDTVEFNMEAAINVEDVLKAGGFGARDDIGHFLPVAIDSTDFEASVRDARDFEEPQGETLRPGLGWTESMDEG